MKYLTEVTYTRKNSDIKYIDTMIITSVKDYRIADKKIREFLAIRYVDENMLDIRINSFDYLEKFTVK